MNVLGTIRLLTIIKEEQDLTFQFWNSRNLIKAALLTTWLSWSSPSSRQSQENVWWNLGPYILILDDRSTTMRVSSLLVELRSRFPQSREVGQMYYIDSVDRCKWVRRVTQFAGWKLEKFIKFPSRSSHCHKLLTTFVIVSWGKVFNLSCNPRSYK